MTKEERIAQVLSIIGYGTARESEIQAKTGWELHYMRSTLAMMRKELYAKPSKTGSTGDAPWIAVDTVIARSVWTEADALAAIAKGDFTTMELVGQSGCGYEPLRLLLARMERDKKIRRLASKGVRRWVLASRKRKVPNKRAPLRAERLLKLIAKHQPVKLEALAELAGRGRFYVRGRLTALRKRGLVKHDVLGESWRFVLADYVRPVEDIGREILLRCKDAGGDCLTWDGAHTPQGHPLVRYGDNVQRVDKVLWTVVHGKTLKDGYTLMRTCETPGCCNHDHHKQATRSESMTAAFKAIGFGGAAHGRKVSAATRDKVGVLTPEQVKLARTSEKTGKALALELGCTPSVVSAARRHETYRDYSNPFAGLGAR